VISGILPVDKPLGWSSHDVVARVRRVAGQRTVGHAGTLDPLATGVLLLVLGRATRLSAYLMRSPKVYCVDVVLGAITVTDDAEAPAKALCPGRVANIQRSDLERTLPGFIGEISQIPPAYAAIKQRGKKLYVLAREGASEGDTITRPPRKVTVYGIDLVSWDAPRLRLRVRCGPGTYVRSLARDIGAALETGGYVHALRRLTSGPFTASQCHTMAELADPAAVEARVRPADTAVLDWPAVVLSPSDARLISCGQPVRIGATGRGQVRLYDHGGHLVALAERDGATDVLKPYRVFHGGT